MNHFLVLVRGSHPGYQTLDDEQQEQHMGRWHRFIESLNHSGHWVAGQPLDATGMLMSQQSARADGIVGDQDVSIGGYFILKAAQYEEVADLCQPCPALEIGGKLEIRKALDL